MFWNQQFTWEQIFLMAAISLFLLELNYRSYYSCVKKSNKHAMDGIRKLDRNSDYRVVMAN